MITDYSSWLVYEEKLNSTSLHSKKEKYTETMYYITDS